MALGSASASAQDWANFATISMTDVVTPKLSNRRVCVTDGRDLLCNGSLYLSSGGLLGVNTGNPNAEVDVYGTVSATNFVGDGSGLTGVIAGATDRIVSGTNGATRMVAVSNTGYISITQAGANSGWFDPTRGLVTLGVSATGPISGTAGYFADRVAINTLSPIATLQVSGSLIVSSTQTNAEPSLYVANDGRIGVATMSPSSTLHIVDSTGLRNVTIQNTNDTQFRGASLFLKGPNSLGTQAATMFYHGNSNNGATQGYFSISGYSANYAYQKNLILYSYDSDRLDLLTAGLSRLRIDSSGNVGISRTAPLAKLDVNGTISASDAIQVGSSSLTCGAGIPGAIRYNGGSLQYCNGTAWTTLGTSAGITGTGSATAVAFWNGANDLTYSDGFYWNNSSKRLGIGTDVPSNTLSISSSININVGSNFANQQGAMAIRDSSGMGLLFDSNQIEQIHNGAGIHLNYNSAAVTTINYGGGNVGVGMQFPTATLQVSGSFIVSTSAQTTTPSLYVGADGKVGVGTAAPTAALSVEGYGSGASLAVKGYGSSNHVSFSMNNTAPSPGWSLWRMLTNGAAGVDMGLNHSTGKFQIEMGGYLNTGGDGIPQFTIDSSSRVGLGTINPLARLDVSGTISATDAVQIGTSSLACSSGIPGAIKYNGGNLQYCNGTSWTTLGTSAGVTGTGSATAVAFWSGPSALSYDSSVNGGFYYDNANKRLGIGLNNLPAVGLTVSSSSYEAVRIIGSGPTGNGSAGYLSFYDSNGTTRNGFVGDGSSIDRSIYLKADVANLHLGDSVNTYLMNLRGGAVGIDTVSPTATLQVSGSFIVSTSGQTTTPSLYVGVDGNIGMGTNNPNGSKLRLAISDSTAFVPGGMGQGADMLVLTNTVGLNDLSAGLRFEVASGQVSMGRINYVRTGNRNGDFVFSTRDGGEVFRIGNNGTISTTNAIQVGTSGLACSAGIPGAIRYNGGNLQYCNGTSWTTLGTSAGVTGTGSATAVAFWSGPSALTYSDGFYWNNTAKRLGIGTDLPQASIHISNSAPMVVLQDSANPSSSNVVKGYISFRDNGGNQYGWLGDGASGHNSIQIMAGAMHALRLYGGGRQMIVVSHSSPAVAVGENHTSPLATLDVAGTISASDAIQVGSSSLSCGAGIPGALRYSSGNMEFCNGSSWTTLGSAGAATAASSTGAIQFNSSNAFGGDTDSLFWDNANKRLGIGTNLPTAAIHVSGSAPATNVMVRVDNTASTGYSALQLGGPGNYGAVFRNGPDAPGYAGPNGMNIGVVQGGGDLAFLTSNAVRMTIKHATGYVGIGLGTSGVVTPTATLQVSGTFSVSSTQFSAAPALYVSTSGRVGVGTNAPLAGLHVSMTSYPTLILERAGASPAIAMTDGTSTTILFYRANNQQRFGIIMPNGGEPFSIREASGNVGVSNTNPLAKLDVGGTISASDAVQIGTSNLNCSNGISGSIRYSAISSTMEYCNSSAWVSMGPSATDVPSFNVHKGGTNQTLPATSGVTQLTWSGENFDPYNNFSSNTFTPTVPGKYILSLVVDVSTGGGTCGLGNGLRMGIRKNGTSVASTNDWGNANYVSGNAVSVIVNANGTTDSFDAFATNACTSTVTISGNSGQTVFSGALISMAGGGGGGGGGASALSQLSDVDTSGVGTGKILAYNGSQWVVSDSAAGSTVEGDRITSGTHAVVLNQASGYVSLSTSGTDWGYLSSGASYLPTLQSARISSTNVSATTVQINGETVSSFGGPGGNFIASGTTSISTSSAGVILMATGGSQRLIVDSSGQVGINTTQPSTTLHVRNGSSGKTFANNSGLVVETNGVANTSFVFQAATGGSPEAFSITNGGRVGIGTATPGANLDVHGTGNIAQFGNDTLIDEYISIRGSGASGLMVGIDADLTGSGSGLIQGGTNKGLGFAVNSGTFGAAPAMFIAGTGNVGIGDITPDAALDVYRATGGAIHIDSGDGFPSLYFKDDDANLWRIYNHTTGNRLYFSDIDATSVVYLAQDASSWTFPSDSRMKANVKDYTVLNRLDGFRTVTFDWKANGKHDIGVIAQEVYKQFPEVVIKGDSRNRIVSDSADAGAWGVNYDKLGALALQGVKELNAKLERELKAANDNDQKLREEIDQLRRDLRELKQANKK